VSARDTPIDESFVAARARTTYTVDIDGEAVVHDGASDRLHHLNPTAALFWHCLDGHSTIAEICTDLAHELGLPIETVLTDVLTLARRFEVEGLLHHARREGTARWHRRPDVLWRRSLDGVVLLPTDAEEPVVLSSTGPAVWDLLASPITTDDLVDRLTESYAADRSAIETDVLTLLEDLRMKGVCVRVAPDEPRHAPA
jgi:hypothetical protein